MSYIVSSSTTIAVGTAAGVALLPTVQDVSGGGPVFTRYSQVRVAYAGAGAADTCTVRFDTDAVTRITLLGAGQQTILAIPGGARSILYDALTAGTLTLDYGEAATLYMSGSADLEWLSDATTLTGAEELSITQGDTLVRTTTGDVAALAGAATFPGAIDIHSPHILSGSADSETAYLYSGIATDGDSGEAGVGTGIVVGSGNSGSTYCYTGDVAGVGVSGNTVVSTGSTVTGTAGRVHLLGGEATGLGEGGSIHLQPGVGGTKNGQITALLPTVDPAVSTALVNRRGFVCVSGFTMSDVAAVAVGSPVALVTGTAKDIITISVPDGSWLVFASGGFVGAGATTMTRVAMSISTLANTMGTGTGAVANSYLAGATLTTIGHNPSLNGMIAQISVSGGPATYRLVANATFGASTLGAFGAIFIMPIR